VAGRGAGNAAAPAIRLVSRSRNSGDSGFQDSDFARIRESGLTVCRLANARRRASQACGTFTYVENLIALIPCPADAGPQLRFARPRPN
jgi:hypothetical protein